MNIYKELELRGLINQVTDEEIASKLEAPMGVYCGFDPTSDSLHVGSLLPIIILKHFENYGFDVIALVGGATGLIGDPSFKKEERTLNTKDVVENYTAGIKSQLSRFLDPEKTSFVNNYDWVSEINTIDFLRDYGKFFTVNYMLAKDSVSSRMDTGLSFTEFSYSILQGLDFNYLYDNYNCRVQIGGSDQWGNLTSGLEIIRRSHEGSNALGLTFPLITKSDGTKFGKSESGTVWLDEKKTSPYEFYQFLLNTADSDVIKYLKYLTFIPVEEINTYVEKVENEPHLRAAQKLLAYEVTKFVHGVEVADAVIKTSQCLFTGDLSTLSVEEIEKYFTSIEQFSLTNDSNIVDALIEVKLASSRREARTFVEAGSISIGTQKITDLEKVITTEDAIGGKYMMIRRGKKKIHFVKVK